MSGPSETTDYPPTDVTGDVDMSLIEYNLSLTPTERIRQNDRARAMVRAFQEAGRKLHGDSSRSAEAPD